MGQIQRKNPTSMITMAGLHQTVKVGPWLFIAGQVPLDSDGNFYGEGDPEKQINQIYTNLTNACAEYGGTLANMVKTTTYVTNTDCFAKDLEILKAISYPVIPTGNTFFEPSGYVIFMFFFIFSPWSILESNQ